MYSQDKNDSETRYNILYCFSVCRTLLFVSVNEENKVKETLTYYIQIFFIQ